MQWFGGYLGLAIMGRMVLPIQRRTRIDSLDVVRGIAVCGIAFVNIAPIVRFDSWAENAVSHFLNLFVQQRFFPIFSLLFGVGFGMMWSRARERSQRPRLVLLRRILFLLALGIPHAMVNSGEALLPYATVALVILLPATWIPQRWLVPVTAGLGALSLVGLLAIGGGSVMIVPSLLLLGFAYAVSGEVEHCEDDFRVFVFACAVLLPAVIGCLYWQLHPSSPEMALQAESVAGTVLAAFYIAVIMLLMHTPARCVLTAVFAPLGRMALTNYVSATLVFYMVKWWGKDALGLADGTLRDWQILMLVVAVMLIVQSVVSALWLRRFKQGPLEQLWRWATWGQWGVTSQTVAKISAASGQRE